MKDSKALAKIEPVSGSVQKSSRAEMDPGLVCLGLVARFHQLPANLEEIKHRFGNGNRRFTSVDILRSLKMIGLKAREVKPNQKRLNKLPLPAIVPLKERGYCILAQVDEHRVLVLPPFSTRSRVMPLAEFEEEWLGTVILATRRVKLLGKDGHFDISWFIPSTLKYKGLFSEVLIAAFFLQIFALISPLFFQVIIDKVLVHRGLTTLDVLAIGMLVIALFEVVLSGLRTYLFSHTTNRIDVELGAKLYTHLISLPLSYFSIRRVGDSVARVRELETIRNFITGTSLSVAIDIPFMFVFFAVMYYYSPTLLLVVLAGIPFYVLLSFFIIPVLRRRLEEKFNRGADNHSFLVESVAGVETIKALAVEPQLIRLWEERLASYVRAGFRVTNLSNIANQCASFINKITMLLVLWIGARAVISGELSVGQLVAFNMLLGRVNGPVLRLVQLWQDFQQTGVSIQRLGDILNAPVETGSSTSQSAMTSMSGAIHFEHVTFRYQPDTPEVLSDVNLSVTSGTMLGIVGQSGSGKSTLTRLIQRLYIPEHGRVLIDDIDLAQINPVWLRRQIGVVLQENFLFNRTVRENIALADPGLSMEHIERAAKMAGAHEFILELKNGYDTLVDEQGHNFSGGQRQRIAIARALVTDPKILIFDEATSALDYESERIIQNNMAEIRAGRTVIIIAHRLSAVRYCDRIIVMSRGAIVEQGGYDQLVGQGGWFADMHQSQIQTLQKIS
ncbi:type I secretion system permease/ATPase [Magnetococcales bacterium HHB-1]